MELWDSFKDWFMGLGPAYGVNPMVFGSIYVGAIPFFTLSLGWLIKNSFTHRVFLYFSLSLPDNSW